MFFYKKCILKFTEQFQRFQFQHKKGNKNKIKSITCPIKLTVKKSQNKENQEGPFGEERVDNSVS